MTTLELPTVWPATVTDGLPVDVSDTAGTPVCNCCGLCGRVIGDCDSRLVLLNSTPGTRRKHQQW
jgi:hypothetical protein